MAKLILLPVYTDTDDVTSYDLAAVRATPELVRTMTRRMKVFRQAGRRDRSLSRMAYWDNHVRFFMRPLDGEFPDVDEVCVVDEEEVCIPEDYFVPADVVRMVVERGTAYWTAWGGNIGLTTAEVPERVLAGLLSQPS